VQVEDREREVWGCARSEVQEQSPWSGGLGAKGIRERSHPEAETLFAFGRSMNTANFPSFLKLGNNKIRFFRLFLKNMKFNKPQFITVLDSLF